MTIALNLDVIFYIGEFMCFYDRIAPISKQLVKYHILRKGMQLHSWKSKRLVFTYIMMYGTVTRTWLTWVAFAKKQLQIKRRKRNVAGVLSWKEAVISHMSRDRCQGCGKITITSVFGTHICPLCRGIPYPLKKKNCYMISTSSALAKAKRWGVPARIVRELRFYRMGHCKLRFEVEVLGEITKYNTLKRVQGRQL
jgi:hypothetical protein